MSMLDRLAGLLLAAVPIGLTACAAKGDPLLHAPELVEPVTLAAGKASASRSVPGRTDPWTGTSLALAGDAHEFRWLAQEDDVVEVVTTEGPPVVHSFTWPVWDEARNEVSIQAGVSWWDDLPDHQPRQSFPTSAGFGRQESTGFGLALSFRRNVVDVEDARVWLGGDFAAMGFAERSSYNIVLPNGERVDDDVTANVVYLTAAGKVDFPVGPVFVFAGGGAGLYHLSFDEEDGYFRTDEIVSDSAFGGYLQLGVDIPVGDRWSVRIQDRMHLVNFDGLSRFTPGNDSISGPIHTFLIGAGIRF